MTIINTNNSYPPIYMKNLFKKFILLFSLVLVFNMGVFVNDADAYVRVKSYFRKDGTYVQSHVRSNPNGLKYDNYSWTPTQGLYNTTYGTRGSTWDTPTYITDPEYYTGKMLYESNNSGSSNINSNSYTLPKIKTPGEIAKPKIQVPANAHIDWSGSNWACDTGYFKSGSACILK